MVGIRSPRGSRWAMGLVLALTLASSASATERVSVAIQFTVIDGEESDLVGITREVRAIVGDRVVVIDDEAWKSALGSDGGGCLDDDGCLGRTLQRSGATHVLQLTVAPYAPRVTVTTRVVDRNGELVRALRTVEVQPGPTTGRAELVRQTLRKVLTAMSLEKLTVPAGTALVKEQPEVEHSREASSAAPAAAASSRGPTSVPETPRAPSSGLRFAKYAAFAVGAVAAVGGVGLALQAQSSASELDKLLVAGALPDRDPATRELLMRTDAQRTQAIVASSIGGALLATGVVLSLITPDEGAQVSAVVDGESAGVRVSGSF